MYCHTTNMMLAMNCRLFATFKPHSADNLLPPSHRTGFSQTRPVLTASSSAISSTSSGLNFTAPTPTLGAITWSKSEDMFFQELHNYFQTSAKHSLMSNKELQREVEVRLPRLSEGDLLHLLAVLTHHRKQHFQLINPLIFSTFSRLMKSMRKPKHHYHGRVLAKAVMQLHHAHMTWSELGEIQSFLQSTMLRICVHSDVKDLSKCLLVLGKMEMTWYDLSGELRGKLIDVMTKQVLALDPTSVKEAVEHGSHHNHTINVELGVSKAVLNTSSGSDSSVSPSPPLSNAVINTNLVTLLAAMYHIGLSLDTNEQLANAIHALYQRQVSVMSAAEVVDSLWYLSKVLTLGIQIVPFVNRQNVLEALEDIPYHAMIPRRICMLLWALNKLQFKWNSLSGEVQYALIDTILRCKKDINAIGVSLLVYSLSNMGCHVTTLPSELRNSLLTWLQACQAHSIPMDNVSMFMIGVAKLGLDKTQLPQDILQVVAKHMAALPQERLSNIIWALGEMGMTWTELPSTFKLAFKSNFTSIPLQLPNTTADMSQLQYFRWLRAFVHIELTLTQLPAAMVEQLYVMLEKTILPKNGLDTILNTLLLFSQLHVTFQEMPPSVQDMVETRLRMTSFQLNHTHQKMKLRQLQAMQFITSPSAATSVSTSTCQSRVAQLIEDMLQDRMPTLNVATAAYPEATSNNHNKNKNKKTSSSSPRHRFM